MKDEATEARRRALRFVSFEIDLRSAVDRRGPSDRDRGRPNHARSANDARAHPTSDDRVPSNTRAPRAIRAAHGPLACSRAHDGRALLADDDPPWRFASGNRRHRRADAERR